MENTKEISKDFTLNLTEITVASGSIPVTWCMSPEWLESHNVDEYWVLLSTCQPQRGGDKAEWRGYCKLSEMMAYVTFFRPGINRIYATITLDKSKIQSWMRREDGHWANQVISFPSPWTNDINHWMYNLYDSNSGSDNIQIDLPKDCFAKEPWEIEKVWVNWLWKNKAIDQCEFRRRRMFAYSVQPLLFLVVVLFRITVAIACLSVGCKGIGWGPVFKPLYYSTSDIVGDIDGSYFVVKKLKEPYSFMFIPMVPFALLGALFPRHNILLTLVSALFSALFIPMLCAVGFVLSFAFSSLIERIVNSFDTFDRFHQSRNEAKVRALTEWNNQQRELMVCSNTKVIRKISDLPKSKRTIKLRFHGLKSMVCRPFAK